jgi:hypothetical protein
MRQTDRIRPQFFFAELLLPLHDAVARRNIHYLKLDREPESYWRPVASRTGGLERLCAAQCGGDAMLERLARYWAARGDVDLPKLVPYLIALRRDIGDTEPRGVEERSEVGDFVYPLF